MTLLCKYANVAGEPGKGFHKARFLGMAAFDLFGTILIAVIVTVLLVRFTTKAWYLILPCVLAALFVLAVFSHWLFCVPTFSNKILGL